jgi:hypothetical protein
MDPARASDYSTAEQVAETVFEAATDGKDQHTYLAGADAKAMFASRIGSGVEAYRKQVRERFFASMMAAVRRRSVAASDWSGVRPALLVYGRFHGFETHKVGAR